MKQHKKKKTMIRNFTSKELQELEIKMKKFKSPIITKIMYWIWFNILRFLIFPIFFVLLVLAFVYNFMHGDNITFEIIWVAMKSTIIFFIIFGSLMAISHGIEEYKIKRFRRKLHLTKEEWNYLVVLFNLER